LANELSQYHKDSFILSHLKKEMNAESEVLSLGLLQEKSEIDRKDILFLIDRANETYRIVT
jgi:hypothetical protein